MDVAKWIPKVGDLIVMHQFWSMDDFKAGERTERAVLVVASTIAKDRRSTYQAELEIQRTYYEPDYRAGGPHRPVARRTINVPRTSDLRWMHDQSWIEFAIEFEEGRWLYFDDFVRHKCDPNDPWVRKSSFEFPYKPPID